MQLEAEYACFNRKRTLSTISTCSPIIDVRSDGIRIADPSQPDNDYLNRFIFFAESRSQIDFSSLGHSRLDIVTSNEKTEMPLLDNSQFRLEYRLKFYGRDPIIDLADSSYIKKDIEIEFLFRNRSLEFLAEVCRSIGKQVDHKILKAKERYYCTDSFRCYLAKRGGNVLGMATLFVSGDSGWLSNAYTFENSRNAGVHSALISQRVLDAQYLGLQNLFTDVEPESASKRNIERLGFVEKATSTVWIRD